MSRFNSNPKNTVNSAPFIVVDNLPTVKVQKKQNGIPTGEIAEYPAKVLKPTFAVKENRIAFPSNYYKPTIVTFETFTAIRALPVETVNIVGSAPPKVMKSYSAEYLSSLTMEQRNELFKNLAE